LRAALGVQPDRWSVTMRREGQTRTLNFRG
jgi:hypothetical protein